VYLLKQLQKEKLGDQYLGPIIYKAYYLDMFNLSGNPGIVTILIDILTKESLIELDRIKIL